MRKIVGIVLLVLFFLTLGYFIYKQFKTDDYSYVVVKINPEVEIVVDSKEIVRAVTTLNEDADVLISNLNFIGKNLEEVTKTLIEETEELGKLENLIEITVINKNEEKRLVLENKLREKVEDYIKQKTYNAILTVKGVTEDMKAAAKTYEISNGKMMLTLKAIELNPELKEEDLVKKSIKEIQEEIKKASIKRREDRKKIKKFTDAQQKQEWKELNTKLKEQHKKNNSKTN